MSRVAVFFILCLYCLSGSAQDLPLIQLHYVIRPPYVTQNGNEIDGLTAGPAIEAFQKAHLKYFLRATPTNRQLLLIQNNEGYDCAIGWFKSEEREKFAQYSEPVHVSQGWGIITYKDFDPKSQSFVELLSNKKNRVLVRDRFIYGEYITGLVNSLKPTLFVTTAETPQMLQVLKSKRADIMFASLEEAEFAVKSVPDLRIYMPSDAPKKGSPRHIICSKKVPPALIEKLNAQLRQIIRVQERAKPLFVSK